VHCVASVSCQLICSWPRAVIPWGWVGCERGLMCCSKHELRLTAGLGPTKWDKHHLMDTVWSLLRDSTLINDTRLTANFPRHPGKPILERLYSGWQIRMMEVVVTTWSRKTCNAPVKSSPPANQHPTFYRPDALAGTQPTVSKQWREIIMLKS